MCLRRRRSPSPCRTWSPTPHRPRPVRFPRHTRPAGRRQKEQAPRLGHSTSSSCLLLPPMDELLPQRRLADGHRTADVDGTVTNGSARWLAVGRRHTCEVGKEHRVDLVGVNGVGSAQVAGTPVEMLEELLWNVVLTEDVFEFWPDAAGNVGELLLGEVVEADGVLSDDRSKVGLAHVAEGVS